MNINPYTLILCIVLAVSGNLLSASGQTLSDGLYRMDSDLRKPGVERNYGGPSDCRVTIQGNSIRIEPQESSGEVWYEGTIKDQQVAISLRHKTPDPMIAAYHFVESWTGHITASNSVDGNMTIYTGTNLYISGTWFLKKTESIQQGGPAYPPQGVGSADP